MSKVDDFKNFVKVNPSLIRYIRNGEMDWQKFYEIYDIYGDDQSVWGEYLNNNSSSNDDSRSSESRSSFKFEDIVRMAKNIDVNKVQDGLTSLQKTLSLFGDLFINKDGSSSGSNYNPRPLYRKFED